MIWLENQRLRPGDAVLCVIDRPSLASLKWFFCVWFLWRVLVGYMVARPHNDNATGILQPFMFRTSSRLKTQITAVTDMACSTNIIRNINKPVVQWPTTPSTSLSSSLSSPSSSFYTLFPININSSLAQQVIGFHQNNRLDVFLYPCIHSCQNGCNTCSRPFGRKIIFRLWLADGYRHHMHLKTLFYQLEHLTSLWFSYSVVSRKTCDVMLQITIH